MEKVFNNILLPVKFDKHVETVIGKAVDIANKLECNLHVVYTFPAPLFRRTGSVNAHKKLRIQEFRDKYYPELKDGLLMITSYVTGNREQEIARYALAHEIDMILTRQHYSKADQLASETNCAVFLTNPASNPNKFEKILLPIGCSLPITRIRVALFLAHQLNAPIHLVPLKDSTAIEEKIIYLKKAYQLLKENTDINLICSMSPDDLTAENKGHASLVVSEPVSHHAKTIFSQGEGACRIECLA